MEYIFGYEYFDGVNIDTVKTVGSNHSDLSGMITIERKYSDSNINDTFKVVRKIRTADDDDGNCYDWYEIKWRSRYIDYFTPIKDQIMPYTETKTAYIGDTEVTFMTDKTGNLTVFFPHPYTVERLTDRIIVSFDELEEVTDITISIL